MSKDFSNKFYGGIRIELEENGTNKISRQVLDKIRLIETQAAELREKGEDPRMVLRDQVDDLATRAAMGNRMLAEAYDEEFDNMKGEWQKYQDKHPQQRLARLQEAKLNNDMLDDDEIMQKARSYATNPGPIDELEAKQTLSRLNKIDQSEAKLFKESAETQQAFTPWLQSEEARSMLHDAETVKALEPGNIAISEGLQAPVWNIIDFDGDLDKEV